MNERAAAALERMRQHAAKAVEYAGAHPRWTEDDLVVDAVAKRVELVAEVATYEFPRALQDRFPEIPWVQIGGMRNRLVHDYDHLNLNVLESVVGTDLPALIAIIDGLPGRPADAS